MSQTSTVILFHSLEEIQIEEYCLFQPTSDDLSVYFKSCYEVVGEHDVVRWSVNF